MTLLMSCISWSLSVLTMGGKTHLSLINSLQGPCAPVTAADLCQSSGKKTSEDIQHFTLDKSEGSAQKNP